MDEVVRQSRVVEEHATGCETIVPDPTGRKPSACECACRRSPPWRKVGDEMTLSQRQNAGRVLVRIGLAALLAAIMLLPLPGAQAAERRVALVVGVGAYKNVHTLPNPPNDARDVAA